MGRCPIDAGEMDPNDPTDDVTPPLDTDGDGLSDEEEAVLGSDPNDADTDDDGVLDGDEPNYSSDTDGDGLINVLDPDSDNDNILDGTELGITTPHADTDVAAGNFVPDADPTTTTSAVNPDTDGGGVDDGSEDPNHNGAIDPTELDPNDPADDVDAPVDSDGDGLSDAEEEAIGSDPNDADTDDDGVLDGDEPNAAFDTDGDGLINVLDTDSDNDGLLDGTEMGITMPHADTDLLAGNFVPDADPTTITSPLDPDTDHGGVPDGSEDPNHNGAIDAGELDPNDPADDVAPTDTDGDGLSDAEEEFLGTDPNDADSDDDGVIDGDEPNYSSDTDGDGLINALDPDSDNDGLLDGTEMGITMPHADTDVSAGNFVPDADPSTVTSPVNPDTDGGGVPDGSEDPNHNGAIDAGELDPNDPTDDVNLPVDSDGDGLSDEEEAILGSDPNDADSDDDGVIDGDEPNGGLDSDGDGLINILDPDSDNDGLFDGTEMGITMPHADTDVNAGNFVPDADPSTVTSPINPDTDGGGVPDGEEDSNHNGAVDPGEGDPNDPSDDVGGGRGFGVAGGGCSTSGGSTGLLWGFFLLLLVMALPRRRRTLATKGAAILVLSFLALPQMAQAQQITGDTDFSVERFQLSSDRLGILDVEGAQVAPHLTLDLGFWAGYANDPLTVFQEQNGDRSRVASLVHHRIGGSLLATLALWDRLAVGIQLPVVMYQNDSISDGVMTESSLSSASVGDLSVIPRVQFLRQAKHGFDLGVRVALTFPTGSSSPYSGDTSVLAEPALLVGRRFGQLRTLLNVGYSARKQQQTVDLEIDDEVFVRLAGAHPLGPVNVEAAFRTSTGADDLFGSFNRNHNEVVGGVSLPFGTGMIGFAAVGVGLSEAFGTPDWRALVGLRLGQDLNKKKEAFLPLVAQEQPLDSDGDGIMDADDQCVDQPEDHDNFQSEDGCPDPDNDGDTVLDVDDACINEPGLVEAQGCPVLDRDGDTVIDAEDNCPDVPGLVENQGCTKKQSVIITGNSLKIIDIVYFRTNKAQILPRSFALLDNVAEVLGSHPNLKQIVIEGHTDSRGKDESNLKLSQRRAESVLEYLVLKNVDRNRLRAQGLGETQPIETNNTNDGRSANRRVEFRIEGSDIKQQRTGPSADSKD